MNVKRLLQVVGIVIVASTWAAVAGAADVYTIRADFDAATAGFTTGADVNFEDVSPCEACTIFGCVAGQFDGATYAGLGIAFASPNASPDYPDGYPLYIAGGSACWWNASNSLSVARFPFDTHSPPWFSNNDDDLIVALDPAATAVGFNVVDSGGGEPVRFLDSAGGVVVEVGLPSGDDFIGIVSSTPIAEILISEGANDNDDVNYDNFIVKGVALWVEIDIKPGSDPNCFNVNGSGVIPVAILGSSEFDVGEIDPLSLSFDGLQVRVRGRRGPLCSPEDSNGDGFTDLVCHFDDDAEYWSGGESVGALTGRLFDGVEIVGEDSICIVP